ncbi:MAG: hypothetical protein ACK4LQ_11665 [Pararhodobacter sp.]
MNYDRLTETHNRIMARLGQGAVELVKVETIPGEFEWSPPVTVETVTPVQATVRGVSAEYVDNTNILAGDLWVQCAIPEVMPEVGNQVRIDGKAHAVMRVDLLPGAGEPVAMRLMVRG